MKKLIFLTLLSINSLCYWTHIFGAEQNPNLEVEYPPGNFIQLPRVEDQPANDQPENQQRNLILAPRQRQQKSCMQIVKQRVTDIKNLLSFTVKSCWKKTGDKAINKSADYAGEKVNRFIKKAVGSVPQNTAKNIVQAVANELKKEETKKAIHDATKHASQGLKNGFQENTKRHMKNLRRNTLKFVAGITGIVVVGAGAAAYIKYSIKHNRTPALVTAARNTTGRLMRYARQTASKMTIIA